jgi:DNA repair protein RecN (Recombination protein N)
MLTSIFVQNFALIDRLSLDFNKGFTVVTGETGSGKSILLGALNLILGERADYSVIRDKNQKTIVEANFNVENYELNVFFKENELDFQNETIVRREITSQGKSRAFINDTPVSLSVLREFSEKMINIHSQHQMIELRDGNFQLDVLDTLAGTNQLRSEYMMNFNKWKKYTIELQNLIDKRSKLLLDADYNSFQAREIQELDLDKEDYAKIEFELNQLENAEDVKQGFAYIIDALSQDGSQGNILDTFLILKTKIDKVSNLHPDLITLNERIKSVFIELKDIGYDAVYGLDAISVDPNLLFILNAKLDKYNRVLRKHNVSLQSELVEIFESLNLNQVSIEDIESEISILEKEIVLLEIIVKDKANELEQKRKEAIQPIEKEVVSLLDELKLPDSKFVINLSTLENVNPKGRNEVQFLFTANKGVDPKSIEKAASGGELSRLMLALQYLLSKKKQLPTIIFDEIDTGVSGEVAQKIGNLLSKIGETMQLLAITHLPQVAGRGQHHWKVQKTHEGEKTVTEVVVLDRNQRIEEVARLMSGDNINNAALENAKALMN